MYPIVFMGRLCLMLVVSVSDLARWFVQWLTCDPDMISPVLLAGLMPSPV